MKTACLILFLSLTSAVLFAQHLGFEQQTYDKKKLTVRYKGEQGRWSTKEGEFNISEEVFWRKVGDSGLAKQAAAHDSLQQIGPFRIMGGVLVGVLGLSTCDIVLRSEGGAERYGIAAVCALGGSYLAYRILAKKYTRFGPYSRARLIADHYNDSLRTALRLAP